MLVLDTDIATSHVRRQSEMVPCCTCFHRLEGKGGVEVVDTLHQCIGDHGNTVIADHAVCFVRRELPHGKSATLLVLV